MKYLFWMIEIIYLIKLRDIIKYFIIIFMIYIIQCCKRRFKYCCVSMNYN